MEHKDQNDDPWLVLLHVINAPLQHVLYLDCTPAHLKEPRSVSFFIIFHETFKLR